MAHMVQHHYYKFVAYTFLQIIFTYFNGYSAMIFFPFYLYRMSNIFINPWIGIFVLGTDTDVSSDQVALANPKLYLPGQSHSHFTIRSYWKWFGFGVWHSVSIYLLWKLFLTGSIDSSGKQTEHWYLSMCIFFSIQFLIEFKALLEIKRIDIFFGFMVILFLFLLVFIPCFHNLAFTRVLDFGIEGVVFQIWTSPMSIVMIFAIMFFALIPDLLMKSFAALLWPTLAQKLNSKQVEKRDNRIMKDSASDSSMASMRDQMNI